MKQYQIKHYDQFASTLSDHNLVLTQYSPIGKQFRSMQAWTLTGEVEDYTTGEVFDIEILQSYNTFVAYRINGQVTRCGKWSSTTAKQTTIWERSFA